MSASDEKDAHGRRPQPPPHRDPAQRIGGRVCSRLCDPRGNSTRARRRGGKDLDIVRMALHDPAALAKLTPSPPPEKLGVIIDISRKRVVLEGDTAPLTFKEFEMLQFLVLREGNTGSARGHHRRFVACGRRGNSQRQNNRCPCATTSVQTGTFDNIVRTVRGSGIALIVTPMSPSPTEFPPRLT